MKRSHWLKSSVGLGALLMTMMLGCSTQQQPVAQITDTWTEAAQRAEAAAGRAEAAANSTEATADRVKAAAARMEARVMQRMRK